MGPKILAAIRFLKNGGERAIITSPEAAAKALRGRTGTLILHGGGLNEASKQASL
jgi:carbamate kinase